MTTPPFPGWNDTASDARFSEPGECARRASSFENRIRLRNMLEYAAGAFVLVLFTGTGIAAACKGEMMIALANALVVAGTIVVLANLRRRAANLVRRPEDACRVHLRRQYCHQRDALRAVPLWYIGPLVPGIALFYGAVTWNVAQVTGWSAALDGIAGPLAITFGIFGAIALANGLAARALTRKIDELDALA